jgi:ribosomal protein L29|tara:strand:- start:207 stop:434 length:228 start_codon:yes stop_codon:yes gene_type:complete
MKIKELQKKESKELQDQLETLRQELVTINAQIATKTTLQNPGRKKSIRKTISRINTLLAQKGKVEKNESKIPTQK